MQRSVGSTAISFRLFAVILFAAVASAGQRAFDRDLGKNTIFIRFDHSVDSIVAPGFSSSLFSQLSLSLPPLGYTIENFREPVSGVPQRDSASIILSVIAHADSDAVRTVTATAVPIPIGQPYRFTAENDLLRPLAAISLPAEDTTSTLFLVARKITESLRERYSRRIVITSIPQGAFVKSSTGLSGVAPVEWLVPFGMVDVYAEKKGFLPASARVHRNIPGIDTLSLTLAPRRFYHSSFFLPAVAAGVASIAFYGAEYYHYDKYRNLGAADLQNNPGNFAQRFKNAQTCERLAYGMLGVCGVSLTLSFFW